MRQFKALLLVFASTLALSAGATMAKGSGAAKLFDMISDKATTVDQVKDYLKSNPVPVDAVDSIGRTPLAAAVVYGREDIFRALYDYFRHPNLNKPISSEIKYWSLYDYILQAGTVSWIDWARANGGKIDPKRGRTEFFEIVLNKLPVVQEFIRRGVKINQTDKDGVTPLMELSSHPHPDVVEELLKQGADVNARDKGGKTPLMYAMDSFSADVVNALLAAHPDVNARDKSGKTALLYLAASFFEEPGETADSDIFAALMKAGADINAKDNEGKTVLLSPTGPNSTLIKLALSYHADVNARNKSGQTPLIWLAFESYESTDTEGLAALLAAHADVNAQAKFGETALILCSGISKCSIPFLQMLVAAGADKCLRSEDGTALEEAIRYQRDPATYSIVGSNKCPPRSQPLLVIVEQTCHLEQVGMTWQTVCY